MPVSERLELLPVLIEGIARDTANSATHGAQLFHTLLRLLNDFRLPPRGSKEDQELREMLRVTDEDANFLAFWFGKLILLVVSRGASATTGSSASDVPACPGLAMDEYKFLTLQGKPETWDPTTEAGLNLTESKVTACKFLASGIFRDDERFMPAVFASADTNSRISEIGDDILKRAAPTVDFEDRKIIGSLFKIYFGDPSSNGPLPPRPPLRMKLLSYLTRSVISTTYHPEVLRLVAHGLDSASDIAGQNLVQGREASKMRSAIFKYVNFLASRGSTIDVQVVAPRLIQHLRSFVERQGWPVANTGEDVALRGYVYEIVGLLAKANHYPDLDLLKWLFQSLSKDSAGKDTSASIEEALSSIMGVFAQSLSVEDTQRLEELLLYNMQLEAPASPDNSSSIHRSTRFVAVRFANRCLPYHDVVARWIDILAIGDRTSSREVVEEGQRGLSLYWHSLLTTATRFNSTSAGGSGSVQHIFPDFSNLTRYVFGRENSLEPHDSPHEAAHVVRRFIQDFKSEFQPALRYCYQILMHQALASRNIEIDVDVDWERKLETAVSSEERARQAIRDYTRTLVAEQHMGRVDGHGTQKASPTYYSFSILLRASFDALLVEDGSEHAHSFIQLCALSPGSVLTNVTRDFRSLEPQILSNNDNARRKAAHAYGLLASHNACALDNVYQSLSVLLERLASWQSAVGAAINMAHGATMALGYYFSRSAYRAVSKGQEHTDRSWPTKDAAPIFQRFISILLEVLRDSTDKTLQGGAYTAISQLSSFMVIRPGDLEIYMPFAAVSDKITITAKTGSQPAIVALGRLAMITDEVDDDDSNNSLKRIEDHLHALHEIRQIESQFTVGEALTCLACGWDSKVMATELDMDGPTPGGPKRTKTLEKVLDRILSDCRASKPSLRKASVIWLLCLMQFCGHRPEIQTRLRSCQATFKRCLSDRDELVQEAASRGLGLVYEKGDRQLKDDLVRDLIGSFSDNKAQLAGNVTEDTQLFEPGALPTGDGSVTTYKDILNLASEVGDSSLVYRFMSLASNNAIWSSRAAFGRFGLTSVLSDSSVDGYLAENPKLYPKLYRYRFDPNPNVQRAMKDIWNALVKDSSAIIKEHSDAIMQDLLENILSKEWRVRQASCAAIADLVQGQSVDKYEKYLGRIWDLCFKVLDDIKDSVRVAAASLARVLTNILTRSLESSNPSKSAGAMLTHVIPFILSTSGLESRAAEVQGFALDTLLQIVKRSSGKALRPFIPELVERLAGLLSTLEPEAVNYLHLNASKYNLTEQKIDDARLASVRGSPLMEAIERCLDLMDDATMKDLVPRLQNAMKVAVSLPTKVGCSRILVTLSTRHNQLFRPHADHFLRLLEKYVLDRNETVSSSYAAAAGYVARTACDEQILHIIEFSKKLYFNSEDDRHRVASGDVTYAISKHATDRFAALAADVLPFVFVAKHDSHEHVKQRYRDTWNENVGGSRAVSLYVKEIVAIAQEHLDSPKWVLKHTAARAVADATVALVSSGDDLSLAHAETLWPAIEKAMAGKTWDGKEEVLKAFVRFVQKGSKLWGSVPKVAEGITKMTVREAKRQNADYRQYAIRALGQIAAARTDIDMSSAVLEIVEPIIEELTSRDYDAMEVDDAKSTANNEKLRDRTLAAGVEALQDSINLKQLQRQRASETMLTVVDLIIKANTASSSIVQIATYDALNSLFAKLDTQTVEHLTGRERQLGESLIRLLYRPSNKALTEALRLKRAQTIVALGKVPWPALVHAILGTRLADDIADEKSPVVRQELAKAR